LIHVIILRRILMRAVFNAGVLLLALTAMPVATQAGTLEGVAIGAGSGALIAGPPGAIVGGVIGGVVGGPDIDRRRHRHCWINDNGYRRCGWR
jgi:osmotically inducible lipoprotein OsmB